ncbi:ABC transporter permease [Peribacillus cavernae]|uniref:ABC transporter permease n=1 Tax=Peribacillus cavernae TaxID=1674310 RepID=A0A3S0VVE0_9BACI|nr:ABC transporter permease [Peribacillus cavernae]MDQ0219859.1 putative spermidine/putrescine transport system permease protein [Peribacillus cavernae]RUQ26649.1 ABC transporter permease [Peribacillus cavernae]
MWLKIIVGIILLALIAPIFVVIPVSFTSSSFFEFPLPGYSAKWYVGFWENGEWIDSLLRSIYIAIFASALSTALGTMAAVAVTKLAFWGKKLFMSFMIAPMIIPVVILGIALYHSFAPLKLTNSFLGLVLGHAVLGIPIVFVMMIASLKGIDRNLELAAMGLGSTPIGAFFKVTVPLIRPAVLSGYLFAFIASLDEVVVTIFLAGAKTKTLPVVMWENLRSQIDPTMAAVSSILIVGTITIFLFQGWFTSRAARLKDDRL